MSISITVSNLFTASPWARALHAVIAGSCLALAGCGGSGDTPPAPDPSAPGIVAPLITQQPADLAVTAGQPASFSVTASGAAPLAYQWQRGGADIAGATASTYTLPATVLGDGGAGFRAVVSNAGGSIASQTATLTVTQSAPVLTITQQPASLGVVAGAQASFVVAATCSAGTLSTQWQRSQGGGGFADIASATAPTYSLAATSSDSGAMFRATLACSGQSGATSQAATLTVSAPSGGASVAALPIVGRRAHADIRSITAMDGLPDGSTVLVATGWIKRLSADMSTIVPIAGGAGSGAVDGPALDARFSQPAGLAHDAAGTVYIADTGNHTIRRLATDGTVSTIAGLAGSSGGADGSGAAARFSSPRGIFMAPDGDLYVADTGNSRIRRVTVAGVVTTYAGSSEGFLDAAPLSARFSQPRNLVVAANGDVIVADTNGNRVRRIGRAGNGAGAVETLAGTGGIGHADAVGTNAITGSPSGMALSGNAVIVRTSPASLRRIDLATSAVTTFSGRAPNGDGYWDGPAMASSLETFGDVVPAANGGFLFPDIGNKVRHADAAGYVRTIAKAVGTGLDPAATGVIAQLPFALGTGNSNNPDVAIAADPSGRLIVAEEQARLVRRIDTAGAVTPIAGLYDSETGSFSSRDGTESAGSFSRVGKGLAVDAAGIVWATDGSCLRRIDTARAVTTRAGDCNAAGTADGPGTSARFFGLDDVALGSGGSIYLAEGFSKTIRKVDAAGNVSTYAGVASQPGSADGPIATARFESPTGVAVGPDGAVYVVDNQRLRRIAPDGQSVSTVAAAGSQVRRLIVDAAGTLYYLTMASDLYMLPAGASSPTLLVPGGSVVVLGAAPAARLAIGSKLALAGPKTLVVLCYQMLVVVNLP